MAPTPVTTAVHGPYEDAVIETNKTIQMGISLAASVAPEQRYVLMDNWIKFWQPGIDFLISLAKGFK